MAGVLAAKAKVALTACSPALVLLLCGADWKGKRQYQLPLLLLQPAERWKRGEKAP